MELIILLVIAFLAVIFLQKVLGPRRQPAATSPQSSLRSKSAAQLINDLKDDGIACVEDIYIDTWGLETWVHLTHDPEGCIQRTRQKKHKTGGHEIITLRKAPFSVLNDVPIEYLRMAVNELVLDGTKTQVDICTVWRGERYGYLNN